LRSGRHGVGGASGSRPLKLGVKPSGGGQWERCGLADTGHTCANGISGGNGEWRGIVVLLRGQDDDGDEDRSKVGKVLERGWKSIPFLYFIRSVTIIN
jgi:hypothetical protein